MDKKAQVEIGPLIMAIFGMVLAFIMARSMDAGVVMIIITTLLCGVGGYFLAYFILNK